MKNQIKFLAVLCVLSLFFLLAFTPNKDKKIIVIDPGHGGEDIGAHIGDALEKSIVESIAKKISFINDDHDIEIVLLRAGDSFVSLNDRVDKVNQIQPNLLISLHINSSKDVSKNGVNAYVSNLNEFYEKSKETAINLVNHLSTKQLAKGEVKDANLFVLKKSKCPAIMVEVGYLSNEKDKQYINSEKGQNEIANQIVDFIKK